MQHLDTRRGRIQFPAYFPVTTFGKKYPLDDLIRPYLPRLAQGVMVSYHYARQMSESQRPTVPLLGDSGGFASLFGGTRLVVSNGLGVLEMPADESGKQEHLHPMEVLEFQEKTVDVAFTLDFPIPAGMDRAAARQRLDLTVSNAEWALNNRRRRDMPLYACIQSWDVESARDCARAYAHLPFDGVAIGGLVPRAHDADLVLRIVEAVRNEVPNKPLHVFGLGKPDMVARLFQRGVQSVDSSSYVKLAADGRLWSKPEIHLPDATPQERLHLALCNLATATQQTLPLSAATPLLFGLAARTAPMR